MDAQFIGLVSLPLRRVEGRSNLGGEARRLPCPDKSGLAMTKSEVPD